MKRALFVVLAAIAALGITALASAGGKPPTTPNNPVITFVSPSPADNATVTGGDVTYAFTFNRTPKQVASVTCALSGEASLSSACDTPVPFPPDSKNTSKSGESYTDLARGDYTFTVTVALTGGGVFSASRDFTVQTDILSRVSPPAHDYVLGVDFTVPSGVTLASDVTGSLSAVDLLIPSPGGVGGSSSGCEDADFAGFAAGSVALLQRGVCDFVVKFQNAQNAGATAIVIMNEGDTPARSGLSAFNPVIGATTIPVVCVTTAVGIELSNGVLNGPTSLTVRVAVRL